MDAAAFQERLSVSRETLARFETYASLLRKWQKAINLVGPKTVDALWERHFFDSAQIFALVGEKARGVWLDLGSGAGFPGLVVALLGAAQVHLVESDGRKATFLREAIRATGAPAQVHAMRVEALSPFAVDVITARAFAPMPRLLDLATPFWREGTIGLFPKGRDVELELTQAAKYWIIEPEFHPSQTEDGAQILRISTVPLRQPA
jgi:16S rRNA (guanine527-N7)-methyltransferase